MSKAKAAQQLRIIGGQFRGRKFTFASADGLRPTGDRIRETLFNWLGGDVQQARCLDLFAGSGALALEALSRGAAQLDVWETNAAAHTMLAAQLKLIESQLDQQQVQLHRGDSLQWLNLGNANAPYDIVFMDPPFAGNLWQHCAELLEQHQWLHADTLIYIESPKDQVLKLPESWRNWRSKTSGQVRYQLFVAR